MQIIRHLHRRPYVNESAGTAAKCLFGGFSLRGTGNEMLLSCVYFMGLPLMHRAHGRRVRRLAVQASLLCIYLTRLIGEILKISGGISENLVSAYAAWLVAGKKCHAK